MLLAAVLAAAVATASPPSDEAPAAPTENPATAVAPAMPAPAPTGRSWFALPVIFWLPATRLGLGATAGLNLPHPGAPRATSLFGAAAITLEEQIALDAAAEYYTRGGAKLSARARLVRFPDVFYGIGPDTHVSAREPFTKRGAELVASAQFPIPHLPVLRLGPRLDLRTEQIGDVQSGGALATEPVPGSDGFNAVAVGGTLTWDTRDSTLWPLHGTFAETWYTYAPDALGRNAGFGRGVLDVRHFLLLGEGRVLGLQAYGEASHGPTPFTLLPNLGSNAFLRGIREGRYRDKLDWATQAELRVPVKGPVAAVGFFALGNVAPSFSDLTLKNTKVAGGVGLRWRLTDAGANIRVDAAISNEGPEVYLLVLEAF